MFNDNKNVLYGFLGTIFDINIIIIPDSGADVSVISSEIIQNIRKEHTIQFTSSQDNKIMGANGEHLVSPGIVVLPVTLDDQLFSLIRFQVIDNLPVDCLLGLDILNQEGILDFGNKTLTLFD